MSNAINRLYDKNRKVLNLLRKNENLKSKEYNFLAFADGNLDLY